MKKMLPVLALVLAASTNLQAGERYLFAPLGSDPVAPPQPTPYYDPGPQPIMPHAPGIAPQYDPHFGPGMPFVSGPLFHNVEYEDLEDIAPHAVDKIVPIRLKSKHRHCLFGGRRDNCSCECCEPPMVFVKICVPPCACKDVRVSRDGTKVVYDYGKYRVELEASHNKVEVEYED